MNIEVYGLPGFTAYFTVLVSTAMVLFIVRIPKIARGLLNCYRVLFKRPEPPFPPPNPTVKRILLVEIPRTVFLTAIVFSPVYYEYPDEFQPVVTVENGTVRYHPWGMFTLQPVRYPVHESQVVVTPKMSQAFPRVAHYEPIIVTYKIANPEEYLVNRVAVSDNPQEYPRVAREAIQTEVAEYFKINHPIPFAVAYNPETSQSLEKEWLSRMHKHLAKHIDPDVIEIISVGYRGSDPL